MSKKRIFDIDFPENPLAETTVTGSDASRRGPMASAISENAEALRERAETERAIREENDRLAHEHVRMKREGLITDLVLVAEIGTSKLARDRRNERDDEIDELKASIRSIGLSNPIRVEVVDGGYELIQGFRRLTAYRELYEETADPAFERIPVGLVAEGDALELLYRRMVDENLVRRDISFAEMAMLASRYAQDHETSATSVAEAVATLFGSTGRQKRNYIGHFASLMEKIGDALAWPEAIPRALGLDLEKGLSENPAKIASLLDLIHASTRENPEEEVEILRSFLVGLAQPKVRDTRRKTRTGAKTILRVARPEGLVRCTAVDGRLELRGDADFSSVDKHRLETALQAFLDAIQSD